MNLTQAQCKIIEQLCSVQFESLKSILLKEDLGRDENGITYEVIFEILEITREDFDKEIIGIFNAFSSLKDNPENLFECLDEIDLEIFEYLMYLFKDDIIEYYPKAYDNLMYKVFLYKTANSMRS